MSTGTQSERRASIPARTLRTDRWWFWPLMNAVGLGLFVVYGTFRIFYDQNYWVEEFRYLAPFYSPCLAQSCVEGSSHFLGQPLPNLPDWMSPAMFILVMPAGFRATCYYYRKTYYRAFWLSPPACAVAEPHSSYSGETRFPLVFQNAHRYFFYLAMLVGAVLTYDAAIAFRGEDGGFGVGLGSLVLVANVVLIWGYTLGCHSCRSIMGGRINHFSRHPVRYWLWTKISWLNARHQQFAWASLFSVLLADVYVLLVASGAISDLRIFN